ncbi:hypothetical protein ACEPAI_2565 [Sanghuangporus weigelae]
MNIHTLDALALIILLVCIRSWLSWRKRRVNGFPLPPGPEGLPIIGNILDMPGENEFEIARQWGKKYGDLVYINNFGTGYLFLNSYESAFELFEKRGNIHSSRPQTAMMELEGWTSWFFTAMPYGERLRTSRRYMNKFFHRTVTSDYYDTQTQSTHKLLLKILENPNDFRNHIKHWAAESIIKITYGYEIVENDPSVEYIVKGIKAFSDSMLFFLVNSLPALRHLPTWFPGAQFHKIAKEAREVGKAMYNEPYKKARDEMANGTAAPSMLSKLLEWYADGDMEDFNETIIAQTATVAYAAGGDTTIASLLTFVFAMVLHPDVMRKGQEELDRVMGRNNLPAFEDRPKLPYIEAICEECFRWQPVAPLGVPHCSEEDDIYNGYFIPAGTVMYSNIWAILRDPKRYPEPDKFIPERWLPAAGEDRPLDANKTAFGFGRRICPGRFFAENSVFIGAASIMAMFDIQKAVDEHGTQITPAEDYVSGIVRHPRPFKCKISPRSGEAKIVIRQAVSLARGLE